MGTAAEQLLNGMIRELPAARDPAVHPRRRVHEYRQHHGRLLRFCNAIVGRFRGGLAQVNVVQSIIFASMSGSALADAAGSGKLMQTLMTRDGKYPPALRGGADGGVVGHRAHHPAVDPARAVRAGLRHVGRLSVPRRRRFPGLLIGAVQMALIAFTARRRNFPVEARVPLREMPRITWEAFPALMMPVILLGLPLQRRHDADRSRRRRRRVRAAGVRAALPQRRLEGRLRIAGHERAHHGVDRHADRRRDGLQLRHHGREHPEDAERDAEGVRAVAAGVPAVRQRPSADSRLLPRGHDDHPRHPPGAAARPRRRWASIPCTSAWWPS